MIEINVNEKKNLITKRNHGGKILLNDNKNQNQYEGVSIIEFYSQKNYLENKAVDNDSMILTKFLKYSTIIFLVVFLSTFLAIHANSFWALTENKWEVSMGWAMIRDIGIVTGIFLCWIIGVSYFFTRSSSHEQNSK